MTLFKFYVEYTTPFGAGSTGPFETRGAAEQLAMSLAISLADRTATISIIPKINNQTDNTKEK